MSDGFLICNTQFVIWMFLTEGMKKDANKAGAFPIYTTDVTVQAI